MCRSACRCVQHGLLPRDKAQAWVDSQKKGAGRSPAKAAPKAAAKRKAAGGCGGHQSCTEGTGLLAAAVACLAAALEGLHACLCLSIAAVQQSVVRSPTPGRCPLPAPAAAASDADDEGEAKPQPKKRKPAAAAAAKEKPAAAAKAKPKAPLIPRKQQAAKQGGWPGGSESVHYTVVVTCALGWLGLLSY